MRRAVVAACAVTATGIPAATVAASTPRTTDVVPCSVAIAQSKKPTLLRGFRLVLGRIMLPRRIVRLDRAAPGWDRFGKVGIDVRAGSPIVLEVPRAWRGVYSLEYAPGLRQVKRVSDGSVRLSIHACTGPLGTWNGYAGGYVVKRAMCVPVVVRANGRSTRVRIAIGRGCTQRAGG